MKIHYSILIPIVIIGIVLLPKTEAVVPPPDGGYPGGNTAEGKAHSSLGTGIYRTAVWLFSLQSLVVGNFNTGVAAGALIRALEKHTATGAARLLGNTTGARNTADGDISLYLAIPRAMTTQRTVRPLS